MTGTSCAVAATPSSIMQQLAHMLTFFMIGSPFRAPAVEVLMREPKTKRKKANAGKNYFGWALRRLRKPHSPQEGLVSRVAFKLREDVGAPACTLGRIRVPLLHCVFPDFEQFVL